MEELVVRASAAEDRRQVLVQLTCRGEEVVEELSTAQRAVVLTQMRHCAMAGSAGTLLGGLLLAQREAKRSPA